MKNWINIYDFPFELFFCVINELAGGQPNKEEEEETTAFSPKQKRKKWKEWHLKLIIH